MKQESASVGNYAIFSTILCIARRIQYLTLCARLRNELHLSDISNIDIRQLLDFGYRKAITDFNDQAKKNCYILSRLIDCVKFCGEFEIALRGHDESSESLNP